MNRPTFLDPRRLVSACILLFAGTVLIQNGSRPLADWDELVYIHLSERMSWTAGDYTTRGSLIEERLPQPVYRSPLFHHPPLVPFLIKAFSTVLLPIGAARLMTALFYALLLWLVFAVTRDLSDSLGGAIALGLVVLCPIFHVEARLIHLDLPMTVFFLAGTHLCWPAHGPVGTARLVASGAMFAAGFLCKLTAPLFIAIPVLLHACDLSLRHRRASLLAFFGALGPGFLWWAYVYYRFGSLTPTAFVGEHGALVEPFTPYLRSIARREWYHLLLYFLAICPLFGIYLAEVCRSSFGSPEAWRRELAEGSPRARLAALNAGAWISAVVFGYVNATGNGYWVFRHFLPVVAIVYVSLGCMLSRLLARRRPVWNAYLVALVMFTAFVMTWSTATTIDLPQNVRPIPVALSWFGLGHLFY